jgi:hypothetical protein
LGPVMYPSADVVIPAPTIVMVDSLLVRRIYP